MTKQPETFKAWIDPESGAFKSSRDQLIEAIVQHDRISYTDAMHQAQSRAPELFEQHEHVFRAYNSGGANRTLSAVERFALNSVMSQTELRSAEMFDTRTDVRQHASMQDGSLPAVTGLQFSPAAVSLARSMIGTRSLKAADADLLIQAAQQLKDLIGDPNYQGNKPLLVAARIMPGAGE